MKKLFLATTLVLSLLPAVCHAEPLRDPAELKAVHSQLQQSISEMEKARAANHYDMAGHGAKVEHLLKEAERELRLAIEAARQAK